MSLAVVTTKFIPIYRAKKKCLVTKKYSGDVTTNASNILKLLAKHLSAPVVTWSKSSIKSTNFCRLLSSHHINYAWWI